MDILDPTGKVVTVTGASSGIGVATARLLHAAGAYPVLAARRGDRIGELAAQLGGALAVRTDVTERPDIARLVDLTVDRHGRIDGLVNNAGVALQERLDLVDLDEFTRMLDLNVVGVLAMTQAVLPDMRAHGSGRIVNVSSGTTRVLMPGTGAYAASKGAVNTLSAAARQELEGDGIAVSLVVPFITATEFAGGRFRPGREVLPGLVPHSPEYVGKIILRALRTGEERIDILPGPEQPELTEPPEG